MNRNARFALTWSAAALVACWSSGAAAQNTVSDPYIAKQLSSSVRGNMFMRLGVTSIFPKTKSGDAYDVTGDVVTQQQFSAAAALGDTIAAYQQPTDGSAPLYTQAQVDYFTTDSGASYSSIVGVINGALTSNGMNGLGTPAGVKARVSKASTVTLSLGYWLSDDYTWVAEAYVLAAPINVKAYGAGVNASGKPNGISGKQILTTKMLPPLATIGRYFGAPDAMFRPYLGVGATYAVFFDTQTTDGFDEYVGGKTKATLKNAFGMGPFAGLKAQVDQDWHVSVAVGQIKIKTEATLVTNNTTITTQSAVTQDYVPGVVAAINFGNVGRRATDQQLTTKLMQLVAMSKTPAQSDLGSFERKQKQELTNTIVNLSVGRSF